MHRLHRGVAVASLLSLAALSWACGGAPEGSAKAPIVGSSDDAKAARLLERAKQTGEAARYRQIIERFPDAPATAEAKEQLARLLVVEAEQALQRQDQALAEGRADEARQLGGLDVTERARAVLDAVDDARAAALGSKVSGMVADGRCASAVKEVASTLTTGRPRERYRKAARAATGEALERCLGQRMQEELTGGAQEEARAVLENEEVIAALSPDSYRQLDLLLQKHIVRRHLTELEPLFKRREWAAALARLEALKAANTLNDKEHEAAVAIVQDAIHQHLLSFTLAAIGGKDPGTAAESIARQVELAHWPQVPADLAALRATLAIAVECEKLGCKLQTPSAQYAWGKIPVAPPSRPGGSAVAEVAHAGKVWVLARGKGHALVSLEPLGKLSAKESFERATGWVPTENLRSVDTELWLPPLEQLVGTRVWGPLRPPAKDYHLGTVTRVEGGRAAVKRMSDGIEETVELSSLRVGKLPKGLKVMAFCVDELTPELARVDAVVVEGDLPKVKVICDNGGKERVEVGSALSSREAWLPPRKP